MHKSRDTRPARSAFEADTAGQLLQAVNSGAAVVRPLFTTYLVFALYVAIIVASTTDEDLLKGSTVKLPLLDANISIVGFYVTAPLFLVLLHLWMLLHFSLICENLHSFIRETRHLPEAKYSLLRQRLDNFTLLHAITHEERHTFREFLVFINALVLGAIPLAGLLMVQARFIAYHDEYITWWHRFLILADIALISYFWPIVMKGQEHGVNAWLKRSSYALFLSWNLGLARFTYRYLHSLWLKVARLPGRPNELNQQSNAFGFPILALPAFVSLFMLCFPDEGIDVFLYGVPRPEGEPTIPYPGGIRWLAEKTSLQMQPALPIVVYDSGTVVGIPFVRRYLDVANLVLVKGKVDSALGERLRRSDPAAIALIEPLNLSGRNLSFANLSGVVMPRAVLENADLTGAIFERAHLEGANLEQVSARDAWFVGTSMLGASLKSASLIGAAIVKADLRLVSLEHADARMTFWREANVAGAILDHANLAGAVLAKSNLSGSSARRLKLTAARMSEVDFPAIDPALGKTIEVGAASITSSQLSPLRPALLEAGAGPSLRSQPIQDYQGVLPRVTEHLPLLLKTFAADSQHASKQLGRSMFCSSVTNTACVQRDNDNEAVRLGEVADIVCHLRSAGAWMRFVRDAEGVFRNLVGEDSKKNPESRARTVEQNESLAYAAKESLASKLQQCLPKQVSREIAELLLAANRIHPDKALEKERYAKVTLERIFYYYAMKHYFDEQPVGSK